MSGDDRFFDCADIGHPFTDLVSPNVDDRSDTSPTNVLGSGADFSTRDNDPGHASVRPMQEIKRKPVSETCDSKS